jgi:hypothetical protein
LLRKKYFETVEFSGDLVIPLREYHVREILAAFLIMKNEEVGIRNEQILESEFYRAMIGYDFNEELLFCLLLSLSVKRFSRLLGVKVIYWDGYKNGSVYSKLRPSGSLCVPADLASSCLEMASWNMNRYRERRVGMTGNIRGACKEGEHFEMSIPENVRLLLEPYRRKII